MYTWPGGLMYVHMAWGSSVCTHGPGELMYVHMAWGSNVCTHGLGV